MGLWCNYLIVPSCEWGNNPQCIWAYSMCAISVVLVFVTTKWWGVHKIVSSYGSDTCIRTWHKMIKTNALLINYCWSNSGLQMYNDFIFQNNDLRCLITRFFICNWFRFLLVSCAWSWQCILYTIYHHPVVNIFRALERFMLLWTIGNISLRYADVYCPWNSTLKLLFYYIDTKSLQIFTLIVLIDPKHKS